MFLFNMFVMMFQYMTLNTTFPALLVPGGWDFVIYSVFLSYFTIIKKQGLINILRIAKRVPVEHPQFAGENN